MGMTGTANTRSTVNDVVERLKRVKTQDLAKTEKSLARGNAGMVRSKMPQVDDLDDFTAWLMRKGVTHKKTTCKCSDLTPTQKHFKTEKVKAIVEAIGKGAAGVKKPILVAQGKVIDGHHRWAAYKMLGPDSTMAVYSVDLKPDEVIKMAKSYGARSEKLASAFDTAMDGQAGETEKDEPETEMTLRGSSAAPKPTPDRQGAQRLGAGDWFIDRRKRRNEAMREVNRTHSDGKIETYDE